MKEITNEKMHLGTLVKKDSARAKHEVIKQFLVNKINMGVHIRITTDDLSPTMDLTTPAAMELVKAILGQLPAAHVAADKGMMQFFRIASTYAEKRQENPLYTVDNVKESLPDVQIRISNELTNDVVTAKVTGRKNPVATVSVSPATLAVSEWRDWQFSWEAVVHSLNTGEPLNGVS
jgi:hypothetical protein